MTAAHPQDGVPVADLVALYGPNPSVAALVAQYDADNPPGDIGGQTGLRFLTATEVAALVASRTS
jgi:hypothetical protein